MTGIVKFSSTPEVYFNGAWHTCPCLPIPAGERLNVRVKAKNIGDKALYTKFCCYEGERLRCYEYVNISAGQEYLYTCDGRAFDRERNVYFILFVKTDGIWHEHDRNYCVEVAPPPPHDTALSIAITDEAGNPITESVVGETVYITGQLRDIVDNVALQGALITLYRNGVATANTDITNSSGIYSIPYTLTSADVPTAMFKTVFGGT